MECPFVIAFQDEFYSGGLARFLGSRYKLVPPLQEPDANIVLVLSEIRKKLFRFFRRQISVKPVKSGHALLEHIE